MLQLFSNSIVEIMISELSICAMLMMQTTYRLIIPKIS